MAIRTNMRRSNAGSAAAAALAATLAGVLVCGLLPTALAQAETRPVRHPGQGELQQNRIIGIDKVTQRSGGRNGARAVSGAAVHPRGRRPAPVSLKPPAAGAGAQGSPPPSPQPPTPCPLDTPCTATGAPGDLPERVAAGDVRGDLSQRDHRAGGLLPRARRGPEAPPPGRSGNAVGRRRAVPRSRRPGRDRGSGQRVAGLDVRPVHAQAARRGAHLLPRRQL
jgi:hypothetical protein